METFLSEIASDLYERYGDDVSSLTVLMPNHRARLFFTDALSRVVSRPVWQPKFVSVNDLMEQIAGIRKSENIKLVTELYKVYSRYHDETFDSFYYWGDMLRADFDQLDKYLIDADMLFANISELHELENHFEYLSPEQIEAIRRFWANFAPESGVSEEKERFITIWETLKPIYHAYRDSLQKQGLAYEGMVHRMAAEKIRSEEAGALETSGTRFVVIGFNALSACEKLLFRWLQKTGKTEFFWDHDHYYTDDQDHEAGLFVRSNLRDFPMDNALNDSRFFTKPKKITSVSLPSDSLQAKYVHTFLQKLIDEGKKPGKETAIVLTDENLLLPVLYAIPEGVEQVNITMGYPLRQTTAYSFTERLLELQHRVRERKGEAQFYHSDVVGLLGHPYMRPYKKAVEPLLSEIRQNKWVYINSSILTAHFPDMPLFRPIKNYTEMAAYLKEMLLSVAFRPTADDRMYSSLRQGDSPVTPNLFSGSGDGEKDELYVGLAERSSGSERRSRVQQKESLSKPAVASFIGDSALNREYLTVILDRLVQLENSLSDSGLAISLPVFASLLRKILQQERIPYQGEPLSGVQIMGILETRTLDFEHILILSVNDDTFPGNRAVTSSFVPHNLRLAYGLPTPRHHEGVYAYYFYRLMQRASVIDLAYCSRNDEKRTGEPSRYIYQLKYESGHSITERMVPLSVYAAPPDAITVPKTGPVWQKLQAFLDSDAPGALSPSSFLNFIECPLKFYYRSVAGLKPEQEIPEEIDLPMFGTILHKAMELLYAPLVGAADPGVRIAGMQHSMAVENAVREAIRTEYFREDAISPEDYDGNVLLIHDIVIRYINRSILPYDAKLTDYTIDSLERRVEVAYPFRASNRELTVKFTGFCDRIDRTESGLLRVVDYKTGKYMAQFASVKSLFSNEKARRHPAAFQTLLYALMLNRITDRDVQPALYYVREMNKPGYIHNLIERDNPVSRFSDYQDSFEENLQQTLSALFDPLKPFTQCQDRTTCQTCEYREICRR